MRPALLDAVVRWLRAGYPQGLPERDYVPLLALLRRRLTDDEVRAVADALIGAGVIPPDHADIGELILQVTDELPSDEDVDRVRAHLAEHGDAPTVPLD